MKNKLHTMPIVFSLLIGMGIYNLSVFLLSSDYTKTFWIAYGFTMLAFLVQLALPVLLMADKDVQKDEYISFSFIICDSVYFVVQLITGILLMILSVSMKISLILEVMIFGFFASVLLSLIMGKNNFSYNDKKYNNETLFIKELRKKAEAIYNEEIDEKKKDALKKIYEAVRYTDPISNTKEIRSIDAEIEESFNLVCKTLTDNIEQLEIAVKTTVDLINKRNIACKSSK